MKIIKQLKDGFLPIWDVIIPRNRDEKWIFGIFFFVFVCFSVLFFLNHGNFFPHREILDYDIAFMFESFSSMSTLPFNGGFKHPLFAVFLYPLNILIFIVSLFYSGELPISYFVVMLFYNMTMALSIVIIYKYCVNLIRISKTQSVILSVLFSFFAYTLLLSFIPETYQLSMFGLLLVIYLITDSSLNNKKIPLITNIVLFAYVSGITITNGLKCIFAQLFPKDKFKNKLKSIFLSGTITFILILLSFFVSLNMKRLPIHQVIMQYVFADHRDIIAQMFFEPIMFHHSHVFWGIVGDMALTYNIFFPILINLVLYAVIICAVVINIRKKAVLLLLSFFGADVLIHLICGFGISNLHIFAPHWLFTFPLLIGWLCKEISDKRIKIGLNVLLLSFSVLFAVHNIPRIIELIY